MMIVMKSTATEEEIQAVVGRIESAGARAHPSRGTEITVIGAIGDREHISRLELEGAPGVDRVVPILKPYKLASSQIRHGEPSVLEIGGRRSRRGHFARAGPPCPRGPPAPPPDPPGVGQDAGPTPVRRGGQEGT